MGITPRGYPTVLVVTMRCLVRQGHGWHFRRRVPKRLQSLMGISEIYRTLKTSSHKLAKYRAAILFLASQHLFDSVMTQLDETEETEPNDLEIKGAVRYWLDEFPPWQRKLSMVRKLPSGEIYHRRNTLAKELMMREFDREEHPSPEDYYLDEAIHILEHANYSGGRKEPKEVLMKVHHALLSEVQREIDTRFNELFDADKSLRSKATTAPVAEPSPMFSEKATAFLDSKAYSAQARRQNEVTFRLWRELIGDRECRTYTKKDADNFRSMLLQLPSSHGKGGSVHARKAIEATALNPGMALMTPKTAKRHFSALSQYWLWLGEKGDVDGNLFSGFSFRDAKSRKKHKRHVWSAEDLERLFRSSDWRKAEKDSAWHWLPLLCLHSGLRLEEACRLRPQDVTEVLGVPCMRISDHPDGWSPKSEAGERDVPVHSWLIRHGFLKLAEKRRAAGSPRIFTDLRPGGLDKRYGFDFSRSFSKMIRSLEIDKKTTFHSFRHSFRTALEKTQHLDRHLAAVGGWEREAKDEGSRTYAKREDELVPILKTVVEDFRPLIDLDEVLKSRA